ncbi:unnamed protein product, partial [Mesorhabditis belari]|uniref:EF-hand domain-containing protein n=1 Tax=Mesorhabditis belari TaxID=2138241 RepID=A0AAF3FPY6_9BILA
MSTRWLIIGFTLSNFCYGAPTTLPEHLSSDQLIPIVKQPTETPEEVFLRLDRNEDNHISFSEFLMKDVEYVHKKMKEYMQSDINGDNIIDFEEFLQSMNAQKTLEKAREAKRLDQKQKEEEGSEEFLKDQPSDEKVASEEIEEMKLDKDTERLLRRANADAFELYDEDGDGVLNEDEIVFMVQDYLEAALLVTPKKLIEEYDMNGDGGLNRKEMWLLEKDMPEDLIESFISFNDDLDGLYVDDSIDLDSSEKNVVIYNKYHKNEKDDFTVQIDDE